MSLPVLRQSTEPGTDQPKVNRNCLSAGGPFKLILGGIGHGGRTSRIEGFLTVDLQEGPQTDIVSDCSKLSMFESGDVSEIYASHVLEHFPWDQTHRVLTEWKRVLVANGRCYISVPDFSVIDRLYHSDGLCDFAVELLWGVSDEFLGSHLAGFDYARLSRCLIHAGFQDVQRLEAMPYNLGDCSKIRENRTGGYISLNVEAVA